MPGAEWSTVEHALGYLSRADTLPHRTEGEGVLLEQIPQGARRVLGLGTGDGRLLALLRVGRPQIVGIALDVSKPMLAKAHERFAHDRRANSWNTISPIRCPISAASTPPSPRSRSITSSTTESAKARKRSLYREIFAPIEPGGVLCNLEHVASPTERLDRL